MIVNSSGVDWGVGGVMVGCRYNVGRSGLLDMFHTALPQDTLQKNGESRWIHKKFNILTVFENS